MDDQQRFDLARAERAKLILEDELVTTALEDMRATIRTAWEASPARDTEGREHLHRYMKVIGQFEGHLRKHMETGKLIAAELQAEEERKGIMARAMQRVRG